MKEILELKRVHDRMTKKRNRERDQRTKEKEEIKEKILRKRAEAQGKEYKPGIK